ncbi:MAG: beta-lactamase family protein [Bacteroidetes bacterium]|nr:beta-lactamase family protein [Bacteroidota bacterium]
MNALKYIIPLLLFSFLIVNCNETEGSEKTNNYNTPEKPVVQSKIDSVKYKAEIYRLDTLFTKLYKADAFNGNVLIAKGKNIIYQKSFGYGIKEKNVLLNDSSIFQLASVSKVITGVATLLLYEQGKLKLETKVSDILADFPYKDVTVKHLLSHRSGLPNYTYFCGEFLSDSICSLSNQNMLDIMIKHKPKAWLNPGLRFNYCNTNYALLALIVEKISQKSYATFLKEELFKPLGMNHSYTALNIDSTKEHITRGYTMKYGCVANDRYDGVVGDKGIYTTTYDLFLLSTALYQHKLLANTTQELAFSPHSKEVKTHNYGYGWRMRNMNDSAKEVFHNGWWHGYRTSFHRRLKDSLTVIVLSNRLNKSVYSTWRIYAAIDGPKAAGVKPEAEEE